MSGTFVTPHPTLEANSQVYKLPSSKPIPSPIPFSPVPNKPRGQALDLRPRSHFVPTTSGSLKENAGSSKSRRHQSSKTLSSFTLTSGSGPTSRTARENGKQAKSPSRSSDSASSRSRSRDKKRLSKFKAKLIQKSKIKADASINDLREHHPSKSREPSFSRSNPFIKRNKSLLLISNAETLLASPFASRAPSPTDCSNLDVAKSGRNESMGPPALVEPLLSHFEIKSFQSKMGRLLQDCDGFSSPEKPEARKRSAARLFDQETGFTNDNDFSWKNRRPSAPSNLQRPSKPVGKAHTPAKRTGHKHLKEENEVNHHMDDHQKPVLSRSDHIKGCDNQLSVELNDNPDPFFWMQERSAVDFNRPPSQLSLHLSSAFIPAEDDAEAESVFWSSGEENDGNNDQVNQRLGANLEAPNSAWLTSTPYEAVVARRLGVPILEGPSIVRPKSRVSMSACSKTEGSVAVGDESEKDMELTAPLNCGGNPGDCLNDSMSFQEHTPWITDSIISPPSAYSEKMKPAVNIENVEKEEHLVSAEQGLKIPSPSSSIVLTQTGAQSSPFRSSYADSTSPVVESAPIGLHELAVRNQELKEEVIVIDGPATVQPQGPLQRTRSGTILGGKNGPIIARRTRTGTIIGPSTIGRTRSGTIVAKIKIPEQNVAVVGNRRTRSGSIIGSVPDQSGNKGVKSSTGSVAEHEPMNTVGAKERVHTTVDGELTQTESTCNGGRKSTIEEVNEVECYVDSLYLTSSPDPIDFLTGGRIDGDESALVFAVLGDWQVADEPPSPEMSRKKKKIQTPRGVGSRSITRSFKLKGHRKNRTRFLGTDGQVEGFESDNPKGSDTNFEDTSDDELLLIEGQSQSLFG